MISGISQNDPTAANTGSSSTPAAASTSQVTKTMFLQLLVAQIKNQDPMSPADGVQFLSQLAQFQQLEQSLNMSQDLSAIRTDLETLGKTGATTGAITGTTTGTTTGTSSTTN
jgi:flagellar basal-body rod modification protein FlgD